MSVISRSVRNKVLLPLVAAAAIVGPLAIAAPAYAASFPLQNCTASVYYDNGRTATYNHSDGNKRWYLIRERNGSLPNPENLYSWQNWAHCYA